MKIKKDTVYYFINIAIILLLVFIVMMQSPLNIWKNGYCDTDCAVFKTIAMQMKSGLMPYKDSFDHKGPLLYIINYVSLFVSYWHGIWVIEFIFLFFTSLFMWKTVQISTSHIWAPIISVFFSLTALYEYYGSNYVEEFAMPFIAVSIYIFTSYFIEDKVNFIRLIVCGFCFGSVLMLRPNMISVWIVFCIFVLIKEVKDKQLKKVIGYVACFLIGVGLVCVPIILWLIEGEAFIDFIYDYVMFNRLYIAYQPIDGRNFWTAFVLFSRNRFIWLASIAIIIAAFRRRRFFNVSYLACIFLTLVMISIGGRGFWHYGMILIPLLAYPAGELLDALMSLLQENRLIWKCIVFAVCIFSSVFYPWGIWGTAVKEVVSCYSTRNDIERTDEIGKVVDYIKENTVPSDHISVWGNKNIIYILSLRMPATKYSYQFGVIYADPKIEIEYFEALEEELPEMIIIARDDDRILAFLDTNNYMEVANFGELRIFTQEA